VEVDVVLLHGFAAVVEPLVFSSFPGSEFPCGEGSAGFFIGDDAVDVVWFGVAFFAVRFLDELLFGAVGSSICGRSPVDRDVFLLGNLLNMRVELISEDAQDAVGELPEAH